MAVFGKKQLNDANSLSQESGDVLSAFRVAVNRLGDINKRAEAQAKAKLEEARLAQEQAAQCEALCNDNNAVITNINNLLNNNQDEL